MGPNTYKKHTALSNGAVLAHKLRALLFPFASYACAKKEEREYDTQTFSIVLHAAHRVGPAPCAVSAYLLADFPHPQHDLVAFSGLSANSAPIPLYRGGAGPSLHREC